MCIMAATGGYINCEVEWEFGHGPGYSAFTYSGLTLSATDMDEKEQLVVSVTVANTELVETEHSVLLFLFDIYRRVTPEYKQFKRFEKQTFGPGSFTRFS